MTKGDHRSLKTKREEAEFNKWFKKNENFHYDMLKAYRKELDKNKSKRRTKRFKTLINELEYHQIIYSTSKYAFMAGQKRGLTR